MSTVLQAALIDLHGIQASRAHVRAYLHRLVCASKPTVKLARVDTALSPKRNNKPHPGDSVVSASESRRDGCEFNIRLRRTFFSTYVRLSHLKYVRKVVGGFDGLGGKVVLAQETHVNEVALTPKTTNQPTQRKWPFENMGKGENVGKHFPLLLPCLRPYTNRFLVLSYI